ncbi:MAG: hypothetical protein F6J87_29675 [Spirulina sp. SIO3F2]|nr:hypothetical protein [Spirulina sp. SIO3F2]
MVLISNFGIKPCWVIEQSYVTDESPAQDLAVCQLDKGRDGVQSPN